jgi:hypothetical protein
MALTGRFDFQKTFRGKIMLRVEEEVPALLSLSGERKMKRRWRNATLMDLTTPEMRLLMDARFTPSYTARHIPVALTPATPAGQDAIARESNVVLLQDPEAPIGRPSAGARG